MNERSAFSLLAEKISAAEHIVIGAGAGLSTAAGFDYAGKRFEDKFSDFHEKYGITDMYSGGFFPFPTQEEFWAWWSRMIYLNRYCEPLKNTYNMLFDLVKDKDYFVITTNVDHLFQKSGFDKYRLFYTQGDYGLFQCSEPCCNKTWDNEETIMSMLKEQHNMKIPTSLLPKCPNCGKPLTLNLRSDDKFVEDIGWHKACERYSSFLEKISGSCVLFLELGVGFNTPAIIKYPFIRMTLQNENAAYACLNYGQAAAPDAIADRSICINGDIHDILLSIKSIDK